jgi:hypothetical protein
MDTRIQTHNLQPAPGKTYIVLPPEPDPEPEPFFSARYLVFAFIVISLAAIGGSIQSGRITLNQVLHLPPSAQVTVSFAPSTAAPAPVASAVHAAPGTVAKVRPAAAPVGAATPIPAPKSFPPDTFVVTSIAYGNPSYAIINGFSYENGQEVKNDSVKGWIIRQITENSVILQNGDSLETVPLSTPKLKPLDDTLQPLN